MKPARKTLILVTAVVGGALLAAAAPAVSQAVFAPAKIAFVDLPEIFKKYDKANEIRTWANRQIQAIDQDVRKRLEDLRKEQSELDILVPGTREYREKKRELDRKAWELKYDEQERKRAVGEAAVKRMNLVYREIRREAANYARNNGLSAVFMYDAREIPARSPEELQAMIATRPVLFRDQALDITPSILDVLQKGAKEAGNK